MRIAKVWNALPFGVAVAKDVKSFKPLLDGSGVKDFLTGYLLLKK